jgi:regulatory protein
MRRKFAPQENAENSQTRAKSTCLRLLSLRARSRWELKERLEQKGFSAAVIRQTLADLRRAGLIDDEEFARSWVEGRLHSRPLGAARLQWELRRRGIKADLAAAVVRRALGDEGELKLAEELARLRRGKIFMGKRSFPLDKSEMIRLGRFLSGRGFSYGIVRKVIHNICGPEAQDEP